ncbi:hypothetical protein MMC20_001562, partial [Loxospora ochrophaea]|nr:hypothetical protein [Loxospora ochrophaea]
APLHFEDPGSENLSSLLDELIALSILENVQAVRLSVLQQIALMVNKFMPSGDVHLVLEKVQRPKTGLLEINNLSENRIRTVFWIAKGLILRLASADTILECLLALLPNAPHGAVAARGFGFILAPDEIISKTNGATIRLLAKQKVFNLCVPAIAKAFRNAEPSTKPNYLVALSGILTHTPHEIIMQEIDTLLPLLLQSLDLADPEVKAATISTLIIISQDSPVTVEGHISSLVNRLLKAAADPKQNTP